MKKPRKHNIDTLTEVLVEKKVSNIVSVLKIEGNRVALHDTWYGTYHVDIKSFCASSDFPLHKNRRHFIKMENAALKLVGKEINGFKIKSLFYGPDRGYKNRSFYVECEAPCGHVIITTVAHLKKHKEPESGCVTCSKTEHGARGKLNGNRIKRTPTYNHWQRIRKTLPSFLQEFSDFRRILGDKPAATSEVVITETGAFWNIIASSTDKDVTMIANAVRQAFRRSQIYLNCLNAAKVETSEGTKYGCAACGGLFKLTQVQIDHIDPIVPLDGSPLLLDQIIPRTWTDKIQVLDKGCHSKKSMAENKLRKENKYGKNKKES